MNIKNPALIILMIIMLVNALAYGIIIPLLYPYAQRFGINPFTLSLMFASFSLAQFIATPIIGRLSDRYGRKPLLLLSLLGTSGALALFASAKNVATLFFSRTLDGITGGNISVAQAVIADTTHGKDRARAFGLLGASFGFGFLVGPAIGGLLSQYGLTVPFWFAAGLALVGTIGGVFFLKETAPLGVVQRVHEPLFRWNTLIQALFSPLTGSILLISLLSAVAQNAWIIGFQSSTVDILKFQPKQVGLLFAGAGLVNILMQSVGIKILTQRIKSKHHILLGSLLFSTVIMIGLFFAHNALFFTIGVLLYMMAFAPQIPMITALLSERTSVEDQGGILGINQSYTSLGQVIGPLFAGVVGSFSIPLVFLMSAGVLAMGSFATYRLSQTHKTLDL